MSVLSSPHRSTRRPVGRWVLDFVILVCLGLLASGGITAPAAQAATEGPATAEGGATGPAEMALGLAAIKDWSVEQPFLDVMKTARVWIGHRPGQWGGMSEAELRDGGYLDQDGWPTSIPTTLRGIGTVILTDLPPEASSLAGRYRLRFDGDGIVEVSGRAKRVRYAPGEVQFDFSPGRGILTVTINRTDRQKTGDYVRNISIVKLDNADRFDAGEVFNPDWTSRIGGFGAFRFMDWMNTNETEVSDWADRPRISDYTYARAGVPVEVLVQLANTLGADPWFNMPHRATDAYIRSFADYVRDALDPGRTVYVEYSNEVWNWQFGQAVWADDHARDRWGVDNGWMQYYGMRTAQMARIWQDAFGTGAQDRLVTVISTQTGWAGLERDALEAPLWVAEDPAKNKPPASVVDAYAIAGYFGRVLGTPERAPVVRQWIADSRREAEQAADAQGLTGAARAAWIEAHKFDAAITLAAQELRDGSVTGTAEDTLADLIGRTFPYHADVAMQRGLDLIMYEGGTHVVGIREVVDDDSLTEFFVALNYTPQMGALYADLLDGWRTSGGRLFNVFVDVAVPGKWGSWGALRYLGDQNPRWDAIIGFQ